MQPLEIELVYPFNVRLNGTLTTTFLQRMIRAIVEFTRVSHRLVQDERIVRYTCNAFVWTVFDTIVTINSSIIQWRFLNVSQVGRSNVSIETGLTSEWLVKIGHTEHRVVWKDQESMDKLFFCLDVFIHNVCSPQAIGAHYKHRIFPIRTRPAMIVGANCPLSTTIDCYCRSSSFNWFLMIVGVSFLHHSLMFDCLYLEHCAGAGLYLESSAEQRSTQCTYLQQGHNYLSESNTLYLNFYSRIPTVRGGFWIIFEGKPISRMNERTWAIHCFLQRVIRMPKCIYNVAHVRKSVSHHGLAHCSMLSRQLQYQHHSIMVGVKWRSMIHLIQRWWPTITSFICQWRWPRLIPSDSLILVSINHSNLWWR
jgi:hypothetical protein